MWLKVGWILCTSLLHGIWYFSQHVDDMFTVHLVLSAGKVKLNAWKVIFNLNRAALPCIHNTYLSRSWFSIVGHFWCNWHICYIMVHMYWNIYLFNYKYMHTKETTNYWINSLYVDIFYKSAMVGTPFMDT